jgi:hypothetical protein
LFVEFHPLGLSRRKQFTSRCLCNLAVCEVKISASVV